MDIDLDLYRHELRVSTNPLVHRTAALVRLSAIDISPDHPQRTLVFIHGFGGQASQWQYQLQKFSLENRVIALDLRGHGLSEAPSSGYDLEQLIVDLETALVLLKVKGKFVLVGHSFGGAIATEYAVKHPDRVERLILIATASEFKLQPMLQLILRLPPSLLRSIQPFTKKWLFAPLPVIKQLYFRSMASWNGLERFQALSVPTMVIRGHRDIVFDRARFEKVNEAVPGSEDVDIGVSGHLVMLERREAVNRAIERFLEGEGQRSWRATIKKAAQKPGRSPLRKSRVWLANYEPGVPYTIGIPNIPVHHLLRSSVRMFPRRPAIFFEGKTFSYRRLNHEANRFANALLSLGMGKGARVALLLPNIPQMVIAFYGTMKAGMTAVFVPPVIEPEEVVRQVRDSEATILVMLSTWAGLANKIQSEAGVPHVLLTDPADTLSLPKYFLSHWRNRGFQLPNALQWTDFLAGLSNKSPGVDVNPDDLAVIIYTGGTTAQSKGVMLSHRNLVANALQTRHWLPDVVEGRERFLCVVPFFHSYGLTACLNVPVSIGAALILKPQFQILDVLQTIRRYRPTIFPGSPSMYVAINSFPGVRNYGIQSINACISGSAPLPVEVQESFEKLTKGHLVEGYGLTEASPITHANPLSENRKIGTIGLPLPSTESKVVDLNHCEKEVKVGQIGELAVRGPQVMMGYWKDPDATKEVITHDGWLLTGDVAQMDEDGYFRIVSRKADMWYAKHAKPAKPNIAFPRDVEEVIYEIPQVKEVAVVGIAGNPFAFVIANGASKERPTSAAVISYCQRRLPPHLVPRFVIFMDDFPRTFIGKVLRRELAKRYEHHSA
jgi:long-chain acyl-CoA synthetase